MATSTSTSTASWHLVVLSAATCSPHKPLADLAALLFRHGVVVGSCSGDIKSFDCAQPVSLFGADTCDTEWQALIGL